MPPLPRMPRHWIFHGGQLSLSTSTKTVSLTRPVLCASRAPLIPAWLYRTRLRVFQAQRRAPVPYHNFYVGECRSLIFGVSLTDYDFARGEGSDKGRPPTIVEKAIAALDSRGAYPFEFLEPPPNSRSRG